MQRLQGSLNLSQTGFPMEAIFGGQLIVDVAHLITKIILKIYGIVTF